MKQKGPPRSGPGYLVLVVAALARRRIERLTGPSASAGHRDLPGVHAVAAVLGARANDGDFLTDLQRLTAPAATLQTVWRTHLGAPVRHLAGLLILHVHVKPHVRIGPFDLGDDAFERDRLVGVELRRERVVGGDPARGKEAGRGVLVSQQ